jgi:hypothetical protein
MPSTPGHESRAGEWHSRRPLSRTSHMARRRPRFPTGPMQTLRASQHGQTPLARRFGGSPLLATIPLAKLRGNTIVNTGRLRLPVPPAATIPTRQARENAKRTRADCACPCHPPLPSQLGKRERMPSEHGHCACPCHPALSPEGRGRREPRRVPAGPHHPRLAPCGSRGKRFPDPDSPQDFEVIHRRRDEFCARPKGYGFLGILESESPGRKGSGAWRRSSPLKGSRPRNRAPPQPRWGWGALVGEALLGFVPEPPLGSEKSTCNKARPATARGAHWPSPLTINLQQNARLSSF